jgi:hypothetical protein
MIPNDNYTIVNIEKTKEFLFNKSYQEPNTGCWIWSGDSVKGGYGRVVNNGRKWLAHRLSYIVFNGEIKKGLTIDHKCVQPSCVNPNHLEAVTMKENTLRGSSFALKNKLKTHCPQGHEYSIENTFIHKDNRRECRACMRIRGLKRYYKNKNDRNRIK